MPARHANLSGSIPGRRWLCSAISAFFALLVGTSWLFSGWLENAAYYYTPLVLALLIASLCIGIRQFQSRDSRISFLAEAAPCLLTIAALVMPYSMVWTKHRLAAARYPLPPDAWAKEITIDPIRWNGTPPSEVHFETALSCREVQQFFIADATVRAEDAVVKSPQIPEGTSANGLNYILEIVTNDHAVLVVIVEHGSDREVVVGRGVIDEPPPYLKRLSERINRW